MKTLEELNMQIVEQAEELNMQIAEQEDVLKKLRKEKDKIIEELSNNYVGKYIKLIDETGSFCIMKISKVAFDEMYTPYRYYGNIFKFCEGDYRYMSDFMLFVDNFKSIEELTEEEYNEFVKQFIDKIIKLK